MVKSRILLMPFALLAMAFVALAPASAVERSFEVQTFEMYGLGFELPYVSIDTDEVAEMRAVQPAIPSVDAPPTMAALGPVYALSLRTHGRSLMPPPHMRC